MYTARRFSPGSGQSLKKNRTFERATRGENDNIAFAMTAVKQTGLLPAGCQPWNSDVCAAAHNRFAYCSTLAIYVYQLDWQFKKFTLHSIVSESKKTITAISWHPKDPDLIATASTENVIIVYNVKSQTTVAKVSTPKSYASSLEWKIGEECVSFTHGRGPLFHWSYKMDGSQSMFTQKDTHFSSDICQFRWHPKEMDKIAFGHKDGSVSFFRGGHKHQKHVLRPEGVEGTEEDDPIVALEWDPLSTDYLLVANTHNGVRMLDSSNVAVIMQFTLPSVAAQVHTLAWITSAPGMFVTGDTFTGTMRIWTVSKPTPIENIKLKKTGFHALRVFHTKGWLSESTELNESSSRTSLKSPTTPTSAYTIPPAHAVCTFIDGGVGLYDLARRKWQFLRDQGHIETIFDCKFKPDNSDLLATGSFDGTVKIWDVNNMSCVDSSPGNEGIIYRLSWAPCDLNCIAACTSKRGAFIWDIGRGQIIKRLTGHAKNSSIFGITWNQIDSRRIATTGADGYCIIHQVDGEVIAKYKHPGPVYGCDWSPNNKDMIATGCEDKIVRVYYLPTSHENAVRTFQGHTAKVFHVQWSPLRDGLLASGSDDGTIRIWDYTKELCSTVLQGHTSPVRGLLWNPELPYLFISGSWDYSIRIWDIRDGACLDTILDHGGDVYGLSSHPAKPFTMASCSRDSTVRIWNLTPIVQPIEINILAKSSWDDIFGTTDGAMCLGGAPLLCGRSSRALRLAVDRLQGPGARHQILRMFSCFFATPGGAENLWELVSVLNGLEDHALSKKYPKGIMHIRHLTKFKSADAQELEIVNMSKFSVGIGQPSKEERLWKAAEINVRVGNLQKYCELLVQLGDWDKALAVSPGVSFKYWQSLAERRANALMQEGNEHAVPYCVATGMVDKLTDYFVKQGDLHDALLSAVAGYEGSISQPPPMSKDKNAQKNGLKENDLLENVQKLTKELSDWYLYNGSSILAACSYMSIDDAENAVSILLRGNELELAASISCVLGLQDLEKKAITFLSRRCERIGQWELGIKLLKNHPDTKLEMAKLCARCAASLTEINDLHSKGGFAASDQCVGEAESAASRGDVLWAVMLYLMSPSPQLGLELGLKTVKEKMSAKQWTADDVFGLLEVMGCVQTEQLQQQKLAKYRNELLILSAYIGGLIAIRRGYDSIVPALFTHVRFLMHREPVKLALSDTLVMSELEAFEAYKASTSPMAGDNQVIAPEQRSTYDKLLQKAGSEACSYDIGPVFISSSNLPSHSDIQHSHFTQRRIKGPAYFLEDGHTAISVNDALMWARVNSFSPLGSGVRINPF